MAGRNITVRWKAPSSEAYDVAGFEYENIRNYVMEHNIPGIDSPVQIPSTAQSFEFENVPIGEYFISLIVVDKFENRSIPFTRQITVANDFAAEIPRLPLMLPLGGFSNAEPMITPGGVYRFKKTEYTLVPKHPKAIHTDSVSLEQSVYSQDVSTIPAIASVPVRDGENFTTTIEDFHYILHQPEETLDKMKLIKYHEKTTSGFGDTITRWYDTGTGNGTNDSDFVSVSGTVFRERNTSKVTGDSTSFLTDIKAGDILKAPAKKFIHFYSHTSGGDINTSDNSIDIDASEFPIISGTAAVYDQKGGSAIGSLVDNTTYYVEAIDKDQSGNEANKIRLHTTRAGAKAGTVGTRITLGTVAAHGDGATKTLELIPEGDTYLGTVNYVVSDTELHLDNFDNSYTLSTSALKRSGLRINRISDTVIAEICKLTNGSYFLNNLLEKDGATEVDAPPTHEDGGLAHYYPLNTQISGKVTDARGSSTPEIKGTGFTISDDSIMGSSVELTGSTGIELLSDSEADSWMSTGKWSVALWAKSTKNNAPDDSDTNERARLISRDRDRYFALMYAQDSSQTIQLHYKSSNGGMEAITLHQAPTYNEWHHFAITANGSLLKVYADGLYIGSVNDYQPTTSDPRPFAIGADVETSVENTTESRSFYGKVTEVNLYKKTLTEGEVQGLYAFPGAGNNTLIQDNVTVIGGGDESIRVDSSGMYLGSSSFQNSPFSVTPGGVIKASAGTIANWTLSVSSLKSGDQADTSTYTASGITLSSQGSIHSPEFYITAADGANFKGTLNASKGNVGGWTLGDGVIHGTTAVSESDSAAILARISSPSGYIEGLSEGRGAIILHSQGSIHSPNFFINSDGTASFSGDISGATGTFQGEVAAESITTNFINENAVTATELTPGTITGNEIAATSKIAVYSKDATGDIIPSSYAALDGANDVYRMYAGDNTPGSAPFRVTKEGKVIANNLQLFDTDDNLFFDSTGGGFTPAALTQLAQQLSGRVNRYSESFTADFDSSDVSTFEKFVLTENTSITKKIRIPVLKMSHTESASYYGQKANPLRFNFAMNGLQNTGGGVTNVDEEDILLPNNTDNLTRDVRQGEYVLATFTNVTTKITITNVTGAKLANTKVLQEFNASGEEFTGSTVKVYFYLDNASESFAFQVAMTGKDNLVFSADVDPVPTTEATALSKIPTRIESKLTGRTPLIGSTPSDIITSGSVVRVTSSAAIAADTFYAKTLESNIIGIDTIHSTVTVVPHANSAVDTQGYITHGTSPASVQDGAGNYWYSSELTVTGGVTDTIPTKRIFDAIVDSGKGFIVKADGEFSQSDLADQSFEGLTLSADLQVPHDFSIDPATSGSSGTVTIEGNLHVTGTTTTVSQENLTVTNGTLTLANGSTDSGTVDGAGIIVDRTGLSGEPADATFLWDNDAANLYWEAFGGLKTNKFHVGDGALDNPSIEFGGRDVGLMARTDPGGTGADEILIVTHDSGDANSVALFNPTGIQSPAKLVFKSTLESIDPDALKIKTISADQDIDFLDMNDNRLVHIDSGDQSVSIKAANNGYQNAALIVTNNAPGTTVSVEQPVLDGTFTNIDPTAIFHTTSNDGYITVGGALRSGIAFANTNGSGSPSMIYTQHSAGGNTMNFSPEGTGAFLQLFSTGGALFRGKCTVQQPRTSQASFELYGQAILNEWSSMIGPTFIFSENLRDEGDPGLNTKSIRGHIKCGTRNNQSAYAFFSMALNDQETITPIDSNTDTKLRVEVCPDGKVRTAINRGLTTALDADFEIMGQTDWSDPAVMRLTTGNLSLDSHGGLEFNHTSGEYEYNRSYIRSYPTTVSAYGTRLVLGTTDSMGDLNEGSLFIAETGKTGIRNQDPKTTLQIRECEVEVEVINCPLAETTYTLYNGGANVLSTKLFIQVWDGTGVLITEILATKDDANTEVDMTEYGVVFTGAQKGVTFSGTIGGTGTDALTVTANFTDAIAARKVTVKSESFRAPA